jgi:hypothetical protein
LDKNLGPELKKAFGRKIPVYTVADLGMSGADDTRVIEKGVRRKCLLVTANADFVDFYRNHEWRKGRDGRFFYSLIFLKHSTTMTKLQQLKVAVKKIKPLSAAAERRAVAE